MTDGSLLFDGPSAGPTLVLAHGAGAPMDSPFMEAFAGGIGERGVRVVRFEFPYMAARRSDGKRRAPDRERALLEHWRGIVERLGPAGRLAIGGKSMGGRMASMVADELGVAALVCLGYPFHPPGRLDRPRTAHLETLETPALIMQGTRDPFGKPEEVASYALPDSIRIHWIEDGNHDLTPRASSGRTRAEAWAAGMEAAAAFVLEVL